MRFVINQNWWSWGDDFFIKNESGQDIYYVDGKAFSFGDSLVLKDLNGTKLIEIQQKMLSFGASYLIYQDGEKVAEVSKHLFTMFRHKFSVDLEGTANDLTAEGDFLDREYIFLRNGEVVGRVSKQFFSFTDTYGVEVEPENALIVLASAIVVDLVCHNKKESK